MKIRPLKLSGFPAHDKLSLEIGDKINELISYVEGLEKGLVSISEVVAHNEKEPQEIHSDYKEHNNMTLPLLAEHLGVELWKAMEIARMISLRPQVKE